MRTYKQCVEHIGDEMRGRFLRGYTDVRMNGEVNAVAFIFGKQVKTVHSDVKNYIKTTWNLNL